MAQSPLVAISILNWNGWQDTLECLESVRRLDYPNYLTIVVLILGGGLLDIAWWYAVCYALSILAYLGTSGRLASWIMGEELRQRIIGFVNPLRLKTREAVVPD